MEENKTEEKKKNWFTSLFTDKDWDFDISKVLGFSCIVCGIAGFFMDKETASVLGILGFGSALLGINKAVGD